MRAQVVCFVAGFGLGLLLASAFSSFLWWEAVGALVLGGALVRIGLLADRSVDLSESAETRKTGSH